MSQGTTPIAFIIPCFNEQERLDAALQTLRAFFTSSNTQGKPLIVFVDDGSTDGTRAKLEAFVAESNPNFSAQLVCHKHNRGKGAAVISGFQAVQAETYGFSDADLSYGLQSFWTSVDALKEYDVIVARRQDKAGEYSRFRNTASRFLHFLARQLTGIKAHDPQSGWKFFSRKAIQEVLPGLTQQRFAFDLELLLLLQAKNFRIHEITLPFTHQQQSSVKTRDGIRYITDLFTITDALPFVPSVFYRQLAIGTLITSILLYGWIVLYGHFFSDDFTWLWYGKQILEHSGNIFTLQAASFFAPVMNAYYAINLALVGPSAPWFFIANIVIHALVAWCSGILAWEISQSRMTAWFTALLVAIAGSAYEPIVWIGANMHSIASLGIIIALYGCVQFCKTHHIRFALLGLAGQLLAYGTKEISIILLPLLALVIWQTLHQKKTPFRKVVVAYGVISTILWLTYAVAQFILQRGGETFATNNYAIGWQGFARIPFALLDLFLPLQAIDHLLSPALATVLGLLTLGTLTYVMTQYRKLQLVPPALGLCVLGILPTIFFSVTSWWEPLASRYTYLPHIGASLLIATILTHTMLHNTRRVIHALTAGLVLVSVAQLAFMATSVTTEYAYVYKTGSTLAHAARLLDPTTTPMIFIYPNHPFAGNQAHIMGALNVYGGYRKDQVVFLKPGEHTDLSPEHMLLYWNPEARQYELTSRPSIFDQLSHR